MRFPESPKITGNGERGSIGLRFDSVGQARLDLLFVDQYGEQNNRDKSESQDGGKSDGSPLQQLYCHLAESGYRSLEWAL